MRVIIETSQGQTHAFVGTYDTLYNNDWNEIIGNIIDSEHEYELEANRKTRHQAEEDDVPAEDE